jgi:hypothetical protein
MFGNPTYTPLNSDWSRCFLRENHLWLGRLRSLFMAMTPIHGVGPVILRIMETKKCNKCGAGKALSEFPNNSASPDGKRHECKSCHSLIGKEWYLNNKEKCLADSLKYRQANSEKIRLYQREYYSNNREKCRESARKYAQNNKEKVRAKNSRLYERDKDRILLRQKQLRDADIEATREKSREYRRKNRDHINRATRQRRAEDVQFRLGMVLRERLNKVVKRGQKAGSAVSDLGCTVPELVEHLESQFSKGMTWDNWGVTGWHIDHIRPLCSFDLTDRDQWLDACSYKNLQPLWAKDNLSKGGKHNTKNK